jgi:hypothetical protein
MTPFERHRAVLRGEEPDRVDIEAAAALRSGPEGGWMRRMAERGMGITHIVPPYRPMFFFDTIVNPYIRDIEYTNAVYFEDGRWKTRHSFATPVGTICSVVGKNPDLNLGTGSVQEHFIKEKKDWKTICYLFRRMYETLEPNYEEVRRDQDTLGQSGTTIGVVDRTPFQRLWIELASLEDTIFAFHDMTEEVQEFLDIQFMFHRRAAEITAGCPLQHIHIIDNITNTISPDLYRKFCMPVYDIYAEQFRGTDKVLSVHHDGLLSHIADEIAEASFSVVDSFTVPPVGDVTITEARKKWPGKRLSINLPPHLAYARTDQLHEAYEAIVAEWGNKCLIIEHVEDMPEETLERHLSAVLDVCGY